MPAVGHWDQQDQPRGREDHVETMMAAESDKAIRERLQVLAGHRQAHRLLGDLLDAEHLQPLNWSIPSYGGVRLIGHLFLTTNLMHTATAEDRDQEHAERSPGMAEAIEAWATYLGGQVSYDPPTETYQALTVETELVLNGVELRVWAQLHPATPVPAAAAES